MMAPALRPVREVLDQAAARGMTLDCWWRDDDAVRHTAELERLFVLSRHVGAPLALAVIPAAVEASLIEQVRAHADLRVLVHGLRHVNHEAEGAKTAEFGNARPIEQLKGDARRGLTMNRAAFADLALPVFVPPWNRVRPELAASLPQLGYLGLSTFAPRTLACADGLVTVNTHLDPVDWRGGRGPLDPADLATALRRVIAAAPPGSTVEPIGILTHHLMFGEELWAFASGLLETLAGHPAVRFPPLARLWDRTKV